MNGRSRSRLCRILFGTTVETGIIPSQKCALHEPGELLSEPKVHDLKIRIAHVRLHIELHEPAINADRGTIAEYSAFQRWVYTA
jgi:hypothetical protein